MSEQNEEVQTEGTEAAAQAEAPVAEENCNEAAEAPAEKSE